MVVLYNYIPIKRFRRGPFRPAWTSVRTHSAWGDPLGVWKKKHECKNLGGESIGNKIDLPGAATSTGYRSDPPHLEEKTEGGGCN